MLDFFRRHQRYFFLVITIVIVISFSFFGTYNTLGSDQWREQIAFRAVDGSDVTRMELDEMALFLGTDTEDKTLFGGSWGPNFLNDGVIRKDFLETGMAEELIKAYLPDLKADLQMRLEKEKRFTLYVHPQASFLSVVNAWNYFAPEMRIYFDQLRQTTDPTDQKSINARVQLFLLEKKVSAKTLRQVLRYQQQQYNWLPQDPNLDRTDLSLFGYHTAEDWFGPRFNRLICEFIINCAKIAEEKGYKVTRAEVLADLMRNTDLSYQQNKNNPNVGVTNSSQYLNEQFRLLRMDQTRAVKIWQQVMLFRRFFRDVGNAALVDAFTYKKFNDYTKEALELEVYRLPKPLRFGNAASLQKFETYLRAISDRPKEGDDLLKVPTSFNLVTEVAKLYPELVLRKYSIELAQVDKKNLQARISLKDTWAWELEEANWKKLQTKFPELGIKASKTREDRLSALDSLDALTRSRVDAYARAAIVDAHPEWIQKALEEAEKKSLVVGLRLQGGSSPFAGLEKNREAQEKLIVLLDKATTDVEAQEQLKLYTVDGQSYYRIKVIERAPQQEIVSFEEASQDGTLEQLRDRQLEKYYIEIRQNNPLLYQNSDQTWKDFSQVKELVAENYFMNIYKAIGDNRISIEKEKKSTKSTHDEDASYRFYSYMRDVQLQLQKDPSALARLVKTEDDKIASNPMSSLPLEKQWLLEKELLRMDRSDENALIDENEAYSSKENTWSDVKSAPNGDLAFFKILRHVAAEEKTIAIAEQTTLAHQMLSYDAQRILTLKMIKEFKEKQAISLAFMQQGSEDSAE